MYQTLDLFAGIGGFSLGLERTGGFETVAFCEIDEYAGKVLKKHWPNVPLFTDVKELTNERLKESNIYPDVITGGFPCQDLSVAGKQAGIDGERSGLWGEYARLISEIRPQYAIMENVSALLSGDRGRWFGRVLGDLAEIGYDAEWHCIPASHLGAPHRRDRAWIVAYPERRPIEQRFKSKEEWGREVKTKQARVGSSGGNVANSASEYSNGVNHDTGILPQREEEPKLGNRCRASDVADTSSFDVERHGQTGKQEPNTRQSKEKFKGRFSFIRERREWSIEPSLGRVANGVPRRMDRLRCLGNAIVPQIATMIGNAILEGEGKK